MIETSLSQSEPMLLPERPTGPLVRSVIAYSLLTALMIITPMLVFVPAALIHCAIRNGRRAATATLNVALVIAAVLVAVPAGAPAVTLSYLATVLLALGIPTLMALPMVARGESFGRVVIVMLGASIAGLVATEIASRLLLDYSPLAAHVEQAELMAETWVQFYRDIKIQENSIAMVKWLFRGSTFLLPSMVIAQMALSFVLSLMMLGRLKAWRERAALLDAGASSAYLFRNFTLPEWLLFLFVLGGVTPLISGVAQQVAANTVAMVAFLYLLQGLAVFRYLLVSIGASGCGMLFVWALVFAFTVAGPGALLLMVTGLFDPFFDFRHFKKRKDDSNESHSD